MSDLQANIVSALSGGQRRTAVELIAEIGVAPQVLDPELARLTDAGVLSIEDTYDDRLFLLAPDAAPRLTQSRFVGAH